MSDRESKRASKLEEKRPHTDPGSRIISRDDRFGYAAARILGLDIPEGLERKMRTWKAIEAAKQRGRYRGGIPQAARDRLLSTSTSTDEEREKIDQEMREAAEKVLAKYR